MNKTFICLSYWNMSLSFIVMVASQLTYGLLNNLNEAGSLPEINDKAQCWHSAHQYCLHEQRTILSAWDIHCKVTVKAQVEWLAFLGRRWHSTSGRNLCQLSCNVTCILTSLESVFCLSQPLHVNFDPGEAICVFDRGVWTLARAGEVVLWRQLVEAWRTMLHSPWGHVLPATDTTQWTSEVFRRVARVPVFHAWLSPHAQLSPCVKSGVASCCLENGIIVVPLSRDNSIRSEWYALTK